MARTLAHPLVLLFLCASGPVCAADRPRIDEGWALAMLLGPGSDAGSLAALLPRYRAGTDPEGRLALAVIGVHLFARDTAAATEALAMEAWSAAKAAPAGAMGLVYRGVAAAFVASKKGAAGGEFLDDFEASFAAVPSEGAHWFLRYWRGITCLRTAKGIKDSFFASLVYGARADAWITAGRKDLDAVRAAWKTASLPAGAYRPESWDRASSPVPDEIRRDMLTVPFWTW